MSEKVISAYTSTCRSLLEKLQFFWSCDQILEGANNMRKRNDILVVIDGVHKAQKKNFNSLQSYVDLTILKPLSDCEAMFIILTDRGNTFNRLNVLSALSALAYKDDDEACLEEIADQYQDHVGVGHLMNNLGVMFSKRMQYERSVTCYKRAKRSFEHEHDHLGNAVATLNLAVLYKLFGHHQKALSSCETAASLCHDISMRTAKDALLPWKVLRRIAVLCQEFGNYKRYQDILSIGALYDINGVNEASTVNLTKWLMTLQLKEQNGVKSEGKELEDFACHLLALLDQSCTDNLLKTESLNADFMAIVIIVAKMYRDIDHLEEACKLLEKLETAFLLVHGRKSSVYGSLLYEIGSFKLGTGKASEAEIKLKQAEEIFIHYFGRDHHMVCIMQEFIGYLCCTKR
ncbi:hypothetical protein OS493_006153 [Desmophyllum pertusum]|uniref:Uncharacterized protein n=1 Tax=Desmophyllum pertusum TaxID=174260 RepID=A0A9X0A4B9_9CNID|nr:hypothetical protein OS493_006153 [Desmophyllum pertusum]